MPRYIDADLLKENLNEIARHSFTLDDDYQYFIKGLIRADDAINETPTADVVERKVGKWEDVIMGRWIYAKCSVCGTVHDTQTKFCPNCGAQISERREDADN